MARRPAIYNNGDPVPKAAERHIIDLGIASVRQYFAWCWANGFEASVDKSKSDLREERDKFEALSAKREAQNRLHKNPKAFLKAACEGDISSDEIERPIFKRTTSEIESSQEAPDIRRSLLDMLLELNRHGDLVFQAEPGSDIPFIRGLIKLHDRKTLWLRPLEDWKPKSKNRSRQFGELTHHLFDQYGDVPAFMEKCWLRDDRPSWRYRDWYVHLGRGHNLRNAKSPVALTKKMAHNFSKAPDNFTAEQAIRWAQMRALGAPVPAIKAIAATRVGRSFENEAFWFTVLRFIADNPMLDPRQVGPLVDYLQNQKYDARQVEIAPGEWQDEPAPQPGLSMQGRTVGTLLRQIEDWHAELGRQQTLPKGHYEAATFKGFAADRQSKHGKVRWSIRQLRSADDLFIEGQELNHCVASYHWSCAEGHCTIWSLTRKLPKHETERRQTIEVDKGGSIVQSRGLANSDPSTEEWSVINAWASEAGLQVYKYL